MITKFIVNVDDVGKRLDKFINLNFPDFSRSYIQSLIEQGKILQNGKIVKTGNRLKINDMIDVEIEKPKPILAVAEDIDFEIVYQDDDLLVINKPQGLVVHPCSTTKNGTLVNGLLAKVHNLSGINGILRPGIVHRLDKDTSGLMLVAKNDFAHKKLAEMIKNKEVERKYLALLSGVVWDNSGHIETFLSRDKKDRKKYAVSKSGKLAISNFNVISRFEKATLVEFSLVTGRTHQIRVHSTYIGHPVVGDCLYGKADKSLKGQLLHSYFLKFKHPRNNKDFVFKINLPDYFQSYLNNLKPFVL